MSNPAAEPPKGRLRQLRQAYTITKQQDRWIGLVLLGTFLAAGAVGFVVGWLVFHWGFGIPLGLMIGLLATMIVFGRRAEKAAYTQVEGQVGAAAGALQMLKRGWQVKPAVGFTKSQDVVHRVVGRPGVVLVAEGNPNRVRNLLSVEKKKHARIAPDVVITEIVVGRDEGQVPLPKLVKHVRKLPKTLKPAEMTPVLSRLKALDAMRPQAPVPRGPQPTSMRGARKMMQGR